MNVPKIICLLFSGIILFSSFNFTQVDGGSLTVKVDNLRNDIGNVQFALYNEDGSIPDEKYKKYYKKLSSEIVNHSSTITFNNLPIGTYALNILHDEDMDSKLDKGWVLPIEGIGFSNYQSIGLSSRPNFSKASFLMNADTLIKVKVIYM
ncbi:MAG: hypothetical protein ACI87N_001529 [Flavobacteriales bacterium]|jgi:uncharacterized protein (DUF2141 family)